MRTKRFAVAAFRLIDSLPKSQSSHVISWQLGKSASSIGANYREANRAESKPDFIHKLCIALKEASESEYWLGLLHDLYPANKQISDLFTESGELTKLFFVSVRTAKMNTQKPDSPTRNA